MVNSFKKTVLFNLILVFLIFLNGCAGNRSGDQEVTQSGSMQTEDMLALTPPMGWNSWNPFGKNVNEKVIRETADYFVSSGLKDLGFNYIVIDDFWQGTRDSVTGELHCNPERFPSGIKALADYVHSRGLKFGIYSDAGTMTCGDQPASYGFEEKDAKLFAEWGVDYLKYDYCYCNDYGSENNDYKEAISRYKKMGDELKATGRSIVFSICEWGPRSPWLWGKEVGGHLWRISYDVGDKWDEPRNEHSQIGILTAIDAMVNLERFVQKGGWNDPDMLVIGLKNSGFIKGGGCTDEEYRTQMSMWCMLAAPLMMGCDVREMSDATKTILLNKDIIAIDQDPLGKQGFRVYRKDGLEVFKKPLTGNRTAIAFLNRNSKALKETVSFMDIEMESEMKYSVYDVWTHASVNQPEGKLSTDLKSHECQVFVLTLVGK